MKRGSLDGFLAQRALASMDLYKGRQSGIVGPQTQAALDRARVLWEAGKLPEWFGDEPSSGIAPEEGGTMWKRLVNLALEEVGVKEEGGNNRGERIVDYQKASWLEPAPWPWCAAFICWLVKEALNGYRVPQNFERPQTAGAWDFENWAKKQGDHTRLIKPASQVVVKAGDIVVFTFSHIGLAVKDESSGAVETVEGNTGPSGGREGDGVWRKSRPKRKIRSVIRLEF